MAPTLNFLAVRDDADADAGLFTSSEEESAAVGDGRRPFLHMQQNFGLAVAPAGSEGERGRLSAGLCERLAP